MEIQVDIDAELLKAASDAERQRFLAALFHAAATVTADYGGTVDFSDSHHWVFTVPDEYVAFARELLAGQESDPDKVGAANFRRHLNHASAVVATWPAWKRDVLERSIQT